MNVERGALVDLVCVCPQYESDIMLRGLRRLLLGKIILAAAIVNQQRLSIINVATFQRRKIVITAAVVVVANLRGVLNPKAIRGAC